MKKGADVIAALYIEPEGAYAKHPRIDAWCEMRDARLYSGPYPVVAHPPCQRWGRFWHAKTLWRSVWQRFMTRLGSGTENSLRCRKASSEQLGRKLPLAHLSRQASRAGDRRGSQFRPAMRPNRPTS